MMITVAVSGINAVDNPGPGTGIIRALKESSLDVKTIGFAYDSMEPGIYLDSIVDKAYILPYPSGSREGFLNRIRVIHEEEKIDVIIPALDAELPLYMDLEREIAAMGIKLVVPTKEMFKMRDKSQLDKLGEQIGIDIPKYQICTSLTDLMHATTDFGFPLMVKGPFYEAFKANSLEEANSYFTKIANKWGYPIIAQQFVKGEEYDVVGLGDGTGEDLGVFAIKKMTTTSIGKVWNAVSIRNENLIEATKRMVKHLKWRGGFEFEVLYNEDEDKIYLLEINPRFPAWVYMSAACGVNLPERLVQIALDLDVEKHSNYKSGKMMIRYTAEMIKDISDFEQVAMSGRMVNKEI